MSPSYLEYLHTLTADRQVMLRHLRGEIKRQLPQGYVERFGQGMLVYEIPLSRFPNTYNGLPLCVAALASQKNYVTLYLMAVYGDKDLEAWFRKAYAKSGKALRMGKSCVHFRTLEEIPLDVIGKAIARVSVSRYIRIYQRARKATRSGK